MPINFLFFNPYYNLNFVQFIQQFFYRLWAFLTGQFGFDQLGSDEVQVFVLMGVAASSALIGTFLVLRRMTMLANSLSHTILMGIVLAFFLSSFFSENSSTSTSAPMQAMLFAALITGFLTAFLTEFLTKIGHLQEDASTGLIFTSFFALGIILVTILTRDAHIGLEAVMGNADALHRDDLIWVYLVLAFNLLIFSLFFKEFKLTTFDPNLALSMGFSPFAFNYLLMAQVSATTITSFRAIGVLLVLAFMTGPVLAGRLLTHRLKPLLIWSVSLGCLCAFVGVALTRHILTIYGIALSTSGVVVCVVLLLYLCLILYVLVKKIFVKNYLSSQEEKAEHLNLN